MCQCQLVVREWSGECTGLVSVDWTRFSCMTANARSSGRFLLGEWRGKEEKSESQRQRGEEGIARKREKERRGRKYVVKRQKKTQDSRDSPATESQPSDVALKKKQEVEEKNAPPRASAVLKEGRCMKPMSGNQREDEKHHTCGRAQKRALGSSGVECTMRLKGRRAKMKKGRRKKLQE